MCIICVKEKGKAFPNEETLRRMYRHNPHGAGFMYAQNGVVEIRKGFMTWEAFSDALAHTRKEIGDDQAFVLHFRITTHGGTCAENTHPFPLTDSIEKMRRLSCNASVGIAHNGIIRSVTPRSADVSDTMEFIASVLKPVARKNPEWYTLGRVRKSVAGLINGSRMAVMDASGDIYRIGEGWIEFNGCWYSNPSFEDQDTRWTKPVPTLTQTSAPTYTYTHARRLPWERDARVFADLMPLSADDIVVCEDGELDSGEWYAITKSKRLYAIGIDDGKAYETDAHLMHDVRYDRSLALMFEIA